MLAIWAKVGLRLFSLGTAGVNNLRNFDFQSVEFFQLLLLLACLILSIAAMCWVTRNGDPGLFDVWLRSSPPPLSLCPKTLVVGIDNPFALRVSASLPPPPPPSSTSSLTDGVSLLRSYGVDSYEALLWGVEIETFYRRLHAYSGRSLLRDLVGGRLFNDLALEAETRCVGHCVEEPFVARASPSFAAECLGSSLPRKRYPLVVVVGVDDNAEYADFDVDASSAPRVVAMATILHLRDDETTAQPSHVMHAFVVTNANQKLRLQPFIPSGSPPEEEVEDDATNVDDAINPMQSEFRSVRYGDSGGGCDAREDGFSSVGRMTETSVVDSLAFLPWTGDSERRRNHSSAEDLSSVNAELETNSARSLSEVDEPLSNPTSTHSPNFSDSLNSSLSPNSPLHPRRRDNCSVCLSLPVMVVTLPCRHAAVCERCLLRLRDKRCPVCRGVIQTHFDL